MDSYVGEIKMFAGPYAPQNWAFCDGQVLSINENELLYALIGTTYGGNGQTTFALPDLRGRVAVHMGQNPSTLTHYPLGQKAGTELVTLTANQLPKHTHIVNASSATANLDVPNQAMWATNANIFQYSSIDANALMLDTATGRSEGGNQQHDNVMPSFPINFIICLYGIYPSQE